MEALQTSLYPDQPAVQTVRQVIALYVEDRRLDHANGAISDKYFRHIEDCLASFARDFGGKLVAVCRSTDLKQWLAMHPTWKAGDTIADHLRAVTACFRWAAQECLIQRNPYAAVPRGVIPPRAPRQAITEAEFERVYRLLRRPVRKLRSRSKFCQSRSLVRVCLWFLWDTGCRTCEAWSARWEHLSWADSAVTLWKHKTSRKVGKPRIVVFGRKMGRLLRLLWRRRGQPSEGPIFLNARGRPWQSGRFAKHFRRYARAAGIGDGVSAYSLRHGFVTKGLLRGVGSKQAADVVGHTTTRYVDQVYGSSTARHLEHLHETRRRIHGEEK